jgi:hypothetical protein
MEDSEIISDNGTDAKANRRNLSLSILADAEQNDAWADRFNPRRFPGLFLAPTEFFRAKARRAARLLARRTR